MTLFAALGPRSPGERSRAASRGLTALAVLALTGCGGGGASPASTAPASRARTSAAPATRNAERPVAGPNGSAVRRAAVKAARGGRAIQVETGDEGTAYSVEVRRPDGRIVQILLDRRLRRVGARGDQHEAGGGDRQ